MRAALLLSVLLASCGGDPKDPPPAGQTDGTDGADAADGTTETGLGPDPYDVVVGPYNATIRWTAYGIPHITAGSYGNAGFGIGVAQARHHGCAIADQVVMARAERSRYFGEQYMDEDFSVLHQGIFSAAEEGFLDLPQDLQDMLVGFAAGYNQWLEVTPEADIPVECRGADWLRPITHIDLLAYYVALGELASGSALKREIGQGQPPGSAARAPAPPEARLQEAATREGMGSNGWAIGGDRSLNGRGMLLSNTHYPWFGNRRWFEMHVEIPGDLEFYGVGLAGILFPVMGFNRHVAWTHTVAASLHFNLNILSLEPGNPTAYLYDGDYRDMEAETYEIEVLGEDGALRTERRTLYRSHHGPVLNAPVLGWTTTTAVSMSDANAQNLAMLPTWFEMAQATTLEELQAAHWDNRGIPWVNTIATDTEGNAWYADTTRVPGWTAEAEARWAELVDEQPFIGLMADYGLFGGDGGDPLFDWTEVKPVEAAPSLVRRDFVANANDSHWLNHSEETLEGYSVFYGSERTPRTPRTRMNLRYLAETGPESASGEDGRFDLDELERAAMDGRSSLAEDLRGPIAARCGGVETVTVGGSDVDIQETCAALAAWDGTYGLEASGAQVFREMMAAPGVTFDDLTDAGQLYAEPFDADAPMTTPAGLAAAPDDGSPDAVLVALAGATRALDEAGVSPDARLGDVQYQLKDGVRHPVPGGVFSDGTIAIASWGGGNDTLIPGASRGEVVHDSTGLTVDGYAANYGNSWVMAMSFTDTGPVARAITTYSQSADASSTHYDDQSTLLGTTERMRPVLFEAEDIAADAELVEETVSLSRQ